jgi:3-hydroxyisobutyrate dehydrogenase-like beta-hydroxyacid dehydrogenase
MRVGFVGLGRMGLPMARNLVRAGHEVAAYNRTRSRADALAEAGARVADTPAEAAAGAEVVVTMLADDAAVEAVTLGGDGLLGALPPGALHLGMSTVGVALSRRLAAEHARAGQGYVAAPVFGRPEAAEGAKLWIVAAGAPEAVDRCEPVFDAVGQGMFRVGEEPEKASVVKLAGNFMLAGMIEALGEAMALGRRHGVEAPKLLEVLTSTLFNLPVYRNYGGMIAEDRFEPAGFALRLGLKDVRLVLEAADEAAVPMPLASLAHDHFLSGVARGWGELDWAGMGRVIAANAGLETRPEGDR